MCFDYDWYIHLMCVTLLFAGRAAWENVTVEEVLSSLQLEALVEIFQKEHITMDILVEMSNDDLQSVGVTAFGHRHKIIRKMKELTCTKEEIGLFTGYWHVLCVWCVMYVLSDFRGVLSSSARPS